MSIYWLLAISGATSVLVMVGGAVWLLTRSSDRLQLATLCLFLVVLLYAGVAWRLFGQGGTHAVAAAALGAYAALLYAAMAVLAIQYRRWAWKVCVGAFGLHIVAGFAVAASEVANGGRGLLGIAIGVVLGGVGLWACLHAGSRALVAGASDTAREQAPDNSALNHR